MTKKSLDQQIFETIEKRDVFVPTDFLHLGSRKAIDAALSRLVKKGVFRRLARGIYDYPKEHPTLGTLFPYPEEIANAIARRDCIRIQPHGAYAANVLGLSNQVPAQIIYLTDGPSRVVNVGGRNIRFEHTTLKNMAMAGSSGLLVQAFRNLGEKHIHEGQIDWLKKQLPAEERKKLLEDLRLVPDWMRPIFIELAEH